MLGNDLLQGVLTLPSIMLLERYPHDNPIKALFQDRGQNGYLQQALDMINNSTIVADCYAVIRDNCAKAAELSCGHPIERRPIQAFLRDHRRQAPISSRPLIA